MNIHTGEIKHFPEGQPVPANYVPLKRLPRTDCRKCNGTGVKRIRKDGVRIPCVCCTK